MPALSETAYWDEMITRANPDENTVLDNVWKRRHQIRLLLRHDFYKKIVLEIGCGMGFTGEALQVVAGNQIRYLGIDISPKAVKIARERIGVHAVVMDARNLKLKPGLFDYVLAMDVLEHIPPADRLGVYAEIDRVMKPHGKLFIHRSFMQSRHDPHFDFPFDERDLAQITKAVGGVLYQAAGYECWIKNKYRQFYQMVVIERGKLEGTDLHPVLHAVD